MLEPSDVTTTHPKTALSQLDQMAAQHTVICVPKQAVLPTACLSHHVRVQVVKNVSISPLAVMHQQTV